MDRLGDKHSSLWVSWETQRRSIELARHFGCDLFIFEHIGWLRYPKCLWQTLTVFFKKKPRVLFVQNPSMFLATVACLLGMVSSSFVIVDRHTTFLLNEKDKKVTLRNILFKILHRFTLKYADLTIVTNDFLAGLVRSSNGRAFVLPDKLPDLKITEKVKLKGDKNIFLISSFNSDEPVEEVLSAMSLLKHENTFLYISGNYKKLDKSIRDNAPSNVVFTGFLSYEDFVNLLFSVDIVMALTTSTHCMLCGCYEAVSAEKPLITSKQKELEDYFIGAVFVDNTKNDICHAIKKIMGDIEGYNNKILLLKDNVSSYWAQECRCLEEYLITKLEL